MPATIPRELTFDGAEHALARATTATWPAPWPPEDPGRVLDPWSTSRPTSASAALVREAAPTPTGHAGVLAEVVRGLEREPRAVVEALARALREPSQEDPLDAARWGPPPDRAEYLQATYAAARRRAAFEESVVQGSVTPDQAAARLGIEPEAVFGRLEARELLAITYGGELLLPAWQFSDHTAGGVLPGLRAVRQAFPGDALAITSWILEPNDALGGRKPRDLLAAGEVEAVVAVADAIGT